MEMEMGPEGVDWQAAHRAVQALTGLVCMWDFQEEPGQARLSSGSEAYALREASGPVGPIGPIGRSEGGLFGPYAADLVAGQWLMVPRAECPALQFSGRQPFTISAWLRRSARDIEHCQAIAGMWNETAGTRQYCLFLNLRIWDSADQVCGHVSLEGGPTPGYLYCMSAAIGSTPVSKEAWHMATFTYDGEAATVYLDGRLDAREGYNPLPYPQGLYDGGEHGSDFTVGAVDRSGEPGNYYEGLLGGLAIYNRALDAAEISQLARLTLPTDARSGNRELGAATD